MKNNSLKFDTEELFNNKELQFYDKDAQIGFLGYLIRNEEWKIISNKIVFPNIKTENEIQRLLRKYDADIMKTDLRVKQGALETISMVGLIKFQNMLNQEKQRIKKIEKKQDLLER